MPSRRQVIGLVATGCVGAFAGCLTPGGALAMTAAETDAEIGEAATTSIDPDRDAETARLLDDALESDRADLEGERPPFDPDRPVRWHDTVYDVSWDVTDERTRTDYVVTADPTDDDDATGPQIAYEDLPDVDREQLGELREELAQSDDEPRVGARVTYVDDSNVDASVLVPESEYEFVVIDDRTVAIDSGETETTIATYTYELTERASTPAAYGTELREKRLVTLGSLSDDERELVEEAISDGRAVVGTGDDAFIALGERLLEHEPIHVSNRVGEWLVEYDGELYWTKLDALRTTELADELETPD